MEGNKDESDKCFQIAAEAFRIGNTEKAIKFLHKAENLYPSQKAKDLLTRVKLTSTTEPKVNKEEPVRRRNVGQSSNKPAEPVLDIDYTKNQLELVQNLKKCKDYYEVLGVTKESTDSELKKAYKKLALQLHPDKNKAPGAVEAFKALGNAVAVLTDPQKRKAYDMYGSEEQHTRNFTRRAPNANFEWAGGRGFESDVTAEELFNMFFGGGFPSQNTARQRRYHQEQREPNNNHPSMAFGLIILFIVISGLSTFFTPDPQYSLQPHAKYNVERRTVTHKIPYYVKDNFQTEYQGSIGRLENSVEEEYITNMKRACYNEKNYREAMVARARNYGSRSQFASAQALKTPSCDTLYRLGIGRINY